MESPRFSIFAVVLLAKVSTRISQRTETSLEDIWFNIISELSIDKFLKQ